MWIYLIIKHVKWKIKSYKVYEDIDNKALLSLMIVSDILLALNSIMYMGEP